MSLTNIQIKDYAFLTAPHWAVGFGDSNNKGTIDMCQRVHVFFYAYSFMVGVIGSLRTCRLLCPVRQPVTSTAQSLATFVGSLKTNTKEVIMSKLSLVISNIPVRQDSVGRYCLNDLHKASGSNQNNKPYNFSRLGVTKDLQAEIEKGSDVSSFNKVQGVRGGTYACKELVYAYAMWISASFSLKVIRAYDALAIQNSALPAPTIQQEVPYQKQPLKIGNDFQTARERIIYILKWTSETRNEALHDDLMSIYWSMDFAKKADG